MLYLAQKFILLNIYVTKGLPSHVLEKMSSEMFTETILGSTGIFLLFLLAIF